MTGKDGDTQPVIVPATSANLGCGFDCAAVALNIYMKAWFRPSPESGIQVRYRGSNPERVATDESNLIVRTMRLFAERAGRQLAGELEIENEIPIGVGLGSSAAAVIGGILLAARHCNVETTPRQVLELAHELEGHVDNAAAALHGGLVFVLATEDDGILTVRSKLPKNLRPLVITPDVVVPTKAARAVLPESYSRGDVVKNLQRIAFLAGCCFSGENGIIPELFNDRIHQPYRCELVPGMKAALELRHPGLAGVAISGSGSSILALVRDNVAGIAAAFQQEFARHGVKTQVLTPEPENFGAWNWEQIARRNHTARPAVPPSTAGSFASGHSV